MHPILKFRPIRRAAAPALLMCALPAALGAQRAAPLTLDHYVAVRSEVPAMRGEVAQIYVRERVRANVLEEGPAEGRVVVFVHGSGTPSEVAFDAPQEGYSWMAHLAEAGFDAFSVEMTGYGRSTRPSPMNDPCNLPENAQERLSPWPGGEAPCEGGYAFAMTTVASDWADIGAAVDYVRRLRGVERVTLVGWSAGGPRAGGFAALHPGLVDRLVLLAPSYRRGSAGAPPESLPAPGRPYGVQTLDDFRSNLERQAPCTDQLNPAVVPVLWRAMLATDPVGATWGPGVRRAPSTTMWGWNEETAARVRAPTLLVAGEHDAQVSPERVRELHEDLGVEDKVFVDLGCASHAAMWEKNRRLLFDATLEWLSEGTVQGMRQGVVRLGY